MTNNLILHFRWQIPIHYEAVFLVVPADPDHNKFFSLKAGEPGRHGQHRERKLNRLDQEWSRTTYSTPTNTRTHFHSPLPASFLHRVPTETEEFPSSISYRTLFTSPIAIAGHLPTNQHLTSFHLSFLAGPRGPLSFVLLCDGEVTFKCTSSQFVQRKSYHIASATTWDLNVLERLTEQLTHSDDWCCLSILFS